MNKKKYTALFGLLVIAIASGQSLLIGDATIPVTVELEPVVHATVDPAVLNFGRIKLGDPAIDSFIHLKLDNVGTSLWAQVVDAPEGWALGNAPGKDVYSVTINDIPMKAELQMVGAYVEPYATTMLPMKFHPPTEDTFGGGFPQKYALRIEARQADEPNANQPNPGD